MTTIAVRVPVVATVGAAPMIVGASAWPGVAARMAFQRPEGTRR